MNTYLHVVGARPNFMKLAPVYKELASKPNISQLVVHTGQHYDNLMSQVFFDQFQLPLPDINLNVGSGTHAKQTADIMIGLEKIFENHHPSCIIVYRDVNSTLAAALVASKLYIPVAHVEAGLRSGDRKMPEEINRILTDQVSELLFTPSEDANNNLIREGIDSSKLFYVGNVMIDTLKKMLPQSKKLIKPLLGSFGLNYVTTLPLYGLVTIHRPSNTDNIDKLISIILVLNKISNKIPLIFPVHPRTRYKLDKLNIKFSKNLIFTEPTAYLDFIALQSHSLFVITDSGGVQEESTYLGVPCLTIRSNTERPVTTILGTNKLIGDDLSLLYNAISNILMNYKTPHIIPPLWDGQAAQRIAKILFDKYK